jgi:predicted DNA-binding transcriptional regulator AlpA
MDEVVRRPQLLELIGVSSVTQWRLEKAGLFPARFRLGKGLVGWHRVEVEEWLQNRERVLRQITERKTVRRADDRALLLGVQTHGPDGEPPASVDRVDRRKP